MTDHKLHHNSTHYEVNVWLNYDGPNNILIRGATQKFPKFECRAKTACSTVVGL